MQKSIREETHHIYTSRNSHKKCLQYGLYFIIESILKHIWQHSAACLPQKTYVNDGTGTGQKMSRIHLVVEFSL